MTKSESKPNKVEEALTKAGFSNFSSVADLGCYVWSPPGRRARGAPYRYKSVLKATAEEIRSFTVSNAVPDQVVPVEHLRLPVPFKTDLQKQVVAQKYPYGNIGVAALYHAKSCEFDLSTVDFYFGCSALEILSAERKTGKKDRAPYLIMKVPGTNIIMIRYNLLFGQDYNLPGFQFERLMTGKRLEDRHDVGFTEHVQTMKIGSYRVLMSAEVDAVDAEGNPAELKLKSGNGGTKAFFQMVGSGSHSLHKGRNDSGVLTSVQVLQLADLAEEVALHHDVTSLESKLIRNMERIKEWDRQGYFDVGKVYRIDFNPRMELHPVQQTLLPPASVVKEVLGLP